MVRNIVNFHRGSMPWYHPQPTYTNFFTWWRCHNIERSMGNRMTICSLMKALMKGRNRQLRFSHKSFYAMGYGVLGSSNSNVVNDIWLWSMGYGVESFWNSISLGKILSIFFKDSTSHDIIKVCKISQSFWKNVENDHVNIESDHNKTKNVYIKGPIFQNDNHKKLICK